MEESDREVAMARKIHDLHHAAVDIQSANTVVDVFETTVQTAESVLAFDSGAVFVADGATFRLAAASGYVEEADRYHGVDEGVAGRTYRESEAQLVADAVEDPDAQPVRDVYRSAVSVPIGSEAVFQAISKTPDCYDERDLELAELLVLHVEAALDRVRSEEQLREQERKTKQLHEVAVDLESCVTREELFDRMIEAAEEILGFDWCGLFTPGEEYFVTTAASADAPVDVGDRTLPLYEGHTGRAYQTGESLLTENSQADEATEPVDEQIMSGLTVPVGDFGVLSAVDSEVGAFDERDLELAELLAANVAEAHDRIEAQAKLRERQRELDLLKQVQSRVLRHNIRNDLTVIDGVAKKIPEVDRARLPELVERITDTADRLRATSEKARQIERVLDHTDRQRRLDLASIGESAAASARRDYSGADVETTTPEQAVACAHRDLSIAVENIVENAIVHNEDPTVRITVDCQGDWVRCQVEDDGSGIPELETSVLEQGGETDLEHGSGVGLWLVDALVSRSDGRLDFESDETGTTVDILVPAAE